MSSVSFKTFVLVVVAAVFLVACGKNEAERSYADACVKMTGAGANRKLCECEAGVVAAKLSPGELKVYLSWPDMPTGVAMSTADLTKFAADHGFTLDDMKSREEKMKTLLPEVNKTCLEKR